MICRAAVTEIEVPFADECCGAAATGEARYGREDRLEGIGSVLARARTQKGVKTLNGNLVSSSFPSSHSRTHRTSMELDSDDTRQCKHNLLH